jgi:hypothetical protein
MGLTDAVAAGWADTWLHTVSDFLERRIAISPDKELKRLPAVAIRPCTLGCSDFGKEPGSNLNPLVSFSCEFMRENRHFLDPGMTFCTAFGKPSTP